MSEAVGTNISENDVSDRRIKLKFARRGKSAFAFARIGKGGSR
jgi:predicted dienelactone hydrolase